MRALRAFSVWFACGITITGAMMLVRTSIAWMGLVEGFLLLSSVLRTALLSEQFNYSRTLRMVRGSIFSASLVMSWFGVR